MAQDAIAPFEADNRAVEDLFYEYDGTTDPAGRRELTELICLELMAHTHIEEKIFLSCVQGSRRSGSSEKILRRRWRDQSADRRDRKGSPHQRIL